MEVGAGMVPSAGERLERDPVPAGPDETVWSAYADFLRRPPELVVEWRDPESPARGWLVLNSLRGGAAGGGTRMHLGLGRSEVTFLAKVMELKFSVSGPPIGGAKAGLDFDPADRRKREVLRRWFEAIRPLLESVYATGGDLNVDEARDVLPLVREAGLIHHQQGALRGHHGLAGAALERRLQIVREALGRLPDGELGLPEAGLRVSDLATGYGVAVASRRLAEQRGGSLDGVRVLLEGFGSVGGSSALFLSRWGARIVGIVDAHGALVREGGLDASAVAELLQARVGNRLPIALSPSEARNERERFQAVEADLCVCAAASGTVDGIVLERLQSQGVEMLVCGANRPFAAAAPGDTALEREADRRFAVVPDFVANCGGAHAFARLGAPGEARPLSTEQLFGSVEHTVGEALELAIGRALSPDRGLVAAALANALEHLERVEDVSGRQVLA